MLNNSTIATAQTTTICSPPPQQQPSTTLQTTQPTPLHQTNLPPTHVSSALVLVTTKKPAVKTVKELRSVKLAARKMSR